MRKGLIISLSIILIALLLSGVWVVKLIWFKPFNFNHFCQRVQVELLRNDPETLVRMGIPKPFGMSEYDAGLADISPDATLKLAELKRENFIILKQYNRNALNPKQRVKYNILYWFLQTSIEGESFLFHNYPITHISGAHIEIPLFFANVIKVETKSDIANYLQRLSAVDEKFGTLIDGLDRRRDDGVIAPTFILRKAIMYCDNFSKTPVVENIFYISFENKLNQISLLNAELKQQYLQKCRDIIQEEIYPAYRRLSGFLLQLKQGSLSIAGVWQLPNGKKYYKFSLLKSANTRQNMEEIYKIGKQEIKRLKREIILELPHYGNDSLNTANILDQFYRDSTGAFFGEEYLSTLHCCLPNYPPNNIKDSVSLKEKKSASLGNLIRFCAFTEGRNLYGQHFLQNEEKTGGYSGRIGILKSDLLSTIRMQTDIGIHYKKWLREQAIIFMTENTGMTETQAKMEVDYIIVFPGRGCAAKIGQLKFIELQKRAKSNLGSKFNLMEFQSMLFDLENMPLEVLEQEVNLFIEFQ